MKTRFVFLLAAAVASSTHLRAEIQIVPGDRGDTAGSNSFLPGFTSRGFIQQLFGSANFSGEMLITSIAFRADEGQNGRQYDSTIARFSMRISTYTRPLADFSGVYDNNRGGDDMLVFDSPVRWTTTDLQGAGPNPFDLRIVLETPFRYNPATGHLLVYFESDGEGDGILPPADFHSHGNENIGRTGSPPTGGGILGNLVTQIGFTPIPEPTFNVALLIAFSSLILRRRAA